MKFFLVCVLAVLFACLAQITGAADRAQVAGTVTAVDTGANRISVHTDKGDAVAVSVTERTPLIRMPAGETDVRKGSKVALAGISAGDRIVAVGETPADPAVFEARSVLVMSREDVGRVQQKDREEWQKRGITGTVTAIDPGTRTLALKTAAGAVTVTAGDKTKFHRYSPDSARFADARPGTLAEIKPGDQVRVLGEKSAGGDTLLAERIVSGAFRQIAATIVSIDASSGVLEVKDLATKKPLAIRVNADTTLRRLPEPMARMLARRYRPGAAAGAQGMAERSGTAAPGPAEAPGDIGRALDRLPAMPLSDLKTGDAIMVSTTAGSDPGRVTAVTLLAGVEPLLTASPAAARDIMSGWNLGSGGDNETP
jgi:hypothetical protein